jgi:uncharacterized protein YbaP (TraB family)
MRGLTDVRRWTALAAAVGLLFAAVPAWAKPPVWVLHGRGATITLFGSVHILPRDVDWEPDALRAALSGADELWFETPIDPASLLDASRQALAKGLLPEGESLSALLSQDGNRRLKAAAETYHLPLPQLDRLRPWLAELTVSAAAYAKDGATPDQGVERQLAEAAPAARRRAFETTAQQIAMFAETPVPVQVESLQDTLKELMDDPDQSKRLIDAWLAGDLKAIDREGVQQLRRSSPALFKVLLTDRNAAWEAVLLKRLNARPARGARPERIVVVVGVGHLAGPGGLPQMLRKRGVRVDGPAN